VHPTHVFFEFVIVFGVGFVFIFGLWVAVAGAGFWGILAVFLGAVVGGKPLFSELELEVFIKSVGYFMHNYTNKLLKIGLDRCDLMWVPHI